MACKDGEDMREILTLMMAALVAMSAAHCGERTADAQPSRFTREDGLLAARACVHEATWAGARTGDCGGMIQVVEARRRDGEPFASALRRTMPRFSAGATARAWTLRLPAGPMHADPIGWPYPHAARVHDAEWLAVFSRVRDYMSGTLPLPCTPEPSAWLGRATDGDVLAARLATGFWREADCGETRNAFLYRYDPD